MERMWTLGRALQVKPDLASKFVEIMANENIKDSTVTDLWMESDAVHVVFEGVIDGMRAVTTVVFLA
ncbi:MAG: hypothetical protein KBS81_01595 [Spirochaetales bacterium]|nr:hypothetical protein [Candidatus Physcosoma equi]